MRRLPQGWLAVLVFLVALLSLGSVYDFVVGVPAYKIWLSQMVGIFLVDGFFPSLPVVAAACLILNCVVRFWFRRLAGGGPGVSLLQWSAVTGLLAILVPLTLVVAEVATQGIPRHPVRLAQGVLHALSLAGDIIPVAMMPIASRVLEFAASLLFVLGLLRSRLVSSWVPGLGVAALTVFAPSLPARLLGGSVWGLSIVVGEVGSILYVLFLVAVGVSLLRRPASVARVTAPE